MVEGTVHRRRSNVTWYAVVLTRLVGKGLVVANVAWFVAGLAVLLFALATGWDFATDRGVAASVALVVAWGLLVGVPGFMLSGVLYAIGQHLMDEQLWRSDLRRGVASVHNLRPGYTDSQSATQDLTCGLDIRVVGMDTISADYRAHIGSLDASRFVEGATFACEISPRLPERVRLWVFADPDAAGLSGRYRDFRPVGTWRPRSTFTVGGKVVRD
jgi:hypothetical protein